MFIYLRRKRSTTANKAARAKCPAPWLCCPQTTAVLATAAPERDSVDTPHSTLTNTHIPTTNNTIRTAKKKRRCDAADADADDDGDV